MTVITTKFLRELTTIMVMGLCVVGCKKENQSTQGLSQAQFNEIAIEGIQPVADQSASSDTTVSTSGSTGIASDAASSAVAVPVSVQKVDPAANPATTKVVPDSRPQVTLSFASVVKKVSPAVVNIYARKLKTGTPTQPKEETAFAKDPFYQQFMNQKSPHALPEKSLGSGVIIDPSGIVITNYHVVKPGDEIRVVLSDKREYFAKLLLVDNQTDLAALQLLNVPKGAALPYLPLEDEENIEVGDVILAIGNPFGVGQTVTSGIVSALARSQKGISNLRSFIQIDAAINPGNSGGALVTTDGRLIGINTAIYSKSGGSVGIGFAVPSILALPLYKSAKAGTPIQRPWAGVSVKALTWKMAESLGLQSPKGALVDNLFPNGPGFKAGLKAGDIILAIGANAVDDDADFEYEIAVLPLDSVAEFTLLRKGTTLKVPVHLELPFDDTLTKSLLIQDNSPLSGAEIQTLSPGLSSTMGLNSNSRGGVIKNVVDGTTASKLRFQAGDVILSINKAKVETVEDITRILAIVVQRWEIEVRRGNQVLTYKIDRQKGNPLQSSMPGNPAIPSGDLLTGTTR